MSRGCTVCASCSSRMRLEAQRRNDLHGHLRLLQGRGTRRNHRHVRDNPCGGRERVSGFRRSTVRYAEDDPPSRCGTPARGSYRRHGRLGGLHNGPEFGSPTKPTHHFDATLADAEEDDLARFSDFEELRGVQFAGRASSATCCVAVRPLANHRGDGRLVVTPPPGIEPMTDSLAAARAEDAESHAPRMGAVRAAAAALAPAGGRRPGLSGRAGRVGGHHRGQLLHRAHARDVSGSTPMTFAAALRVTSSDWQESNQLLAGIMTDFGTHTGPVVSAARANLTARHDRCLPGGPACREPSAVRTCAWEPGARAPPPSSSTTRTREGDRRGRPAGWVRITPTDSFHWATHVTMAGRGNQRADSRGAARSRQPAACVPDRRLPPCRPADPRLPSDGKYRHHWLRRL